MPINPDALGATGTSEHSWNSKDALLYAVGVGAGATDPHAELQFTTENSKGVEQQVLPTFAVIVGMGGAAMATSVRSTRRWSSTASRPSLFSARCRLTGASGRPRRSPASRTRARAR